MLTKDKIIALHAEFDAVMKQFAEKHNLVVGGTRFKYSADSFEVANLRFQTKESNPNEIDPRYLRDLQRNGFKYGLTTTMVGTSLTLPGSGGRTNYEFVGMRASKAVCICTQDGKPYLWDAKFIAAQIKLQAK